MPRARSHSVTTKADQIQPQRRRAYSNPGTPFPTGITVSPNTAPIEVPIACIYLEQPPRKDLAEVHKFPDQCINLFDAGRFTQCIFKFLPTMYRCWYAEHSDEDLDEYVGERLRWLKDNRLAYHSGICLDWPYARFFSHDIMNELAGLDDQAKRNLDYVSFDDGRQEYYFLYNLLTARILSWATEYFNLHGLYGFRKGINPEGKEELYPFRPKENQDPEPGQIFYKAADAFRAGLIATRYDPVMAPNALVTGRIFLNAISTPHVPAPGEKCPICKNCFIPGPDGDEDMPPENAVKTKCHHVLGAECLDRWANPEGEGLLPQLRCPVCRHVLHEAPERDWCYKVNSRGREHVENFWLQDEVEFWLRHDVAGVPWGWACAVGAAF